MKKYIFIVIVLLVCALAVSIYDSRQMEKKYEVVMANIKSYDGLLETSMNRNHALQLTINQLNTFKDSVLNEMMKIKDSLNVKDKNLKSLHYLSSVGTRTDTLVFVDTLFRDKGLSLDTLIGDAWYETRLKLRYPNFIELTPFFISKKYIVVSMRKETIKPRKKYWIQRIFQKKHKVLQVDVVEENPYIENGDSKYVEVIK